MKTFSLTKDLCTVNWYIIDCKKAILGRLCTKVAHILQNKHLVSYTPNMKIHGSHVILINSDCIQVTGQKLQQKIYYKHTGYIGHLRQKTLGKQMSDDSTEVLKHGVRGMLSRGKGRNQMMKRLHIYKNDQHNHSAQKPIDITNEVEGQ